MKTSSTVHYSEDAPLQETVDPSDWNKIREVMANLLVDEEQEAFVPWTNELTGTVGTIVPMEASLAGDGVFCRTFSTTLNAVGGVLQYRGDACRRQSGDVELINLKPHNAVVEIDQTPEETKIQ